MHSKIKSLLVVITIASMMVVSGCGKTRTAGYKVDLEIWGLFDSNEVFGEIVKAYSEVNPFVGNIVYKKFTPENYKNDILDAMASGNGPDIFLMHNTWLPMFRDKVEISPEIILGEQEFRNNFVDVVADDFLENGQIYAVPLSVDSLALYYNKDLFNTQGIVSPPENWEDFNEDVKKLTKIDELGNIIQAGAAMGTAYNINRSTDILDLLMLQNGVAMPQKKDDRIHFGTTVDTEGESANRSEAAFEFYTQFAKTSSAVYTWNDSQKMHYSLDSFYEGSVAMMLNYSWHYENIKSKNSKLNFAVAPVPQLNKNNPVNYANYWAYAVNKNKEPRQSSNNSPVPTDEMRIHESWQFLKFLTTKNNGGVEIIHAVSGGKNSSVVALDPAMNYAEKTGKPAARRDIIEIQKNNSVVGPFAYGNLIARSWYKEDAAAFEGIMAELIGSVDKGDINVLEALRLATSRMNQIIINDR